MSKGSTSIEIHALAESIHYLLDIGLKNKLKFHFFLSHSVNRFLKI